MMQKLAWCATVAFIGAILVPAGAGAQTEFDGGNDPSGQCRQCVGVIELDHSESHYYLHQACTSGSDCVHCGGSGQDVCVGFDNRIAGTCPGGDCGTELPETLALLTSAVESGDADALVDLLRSPRRRLAIDVNSTSITVKGCLGESVRSFEMTQSLSADVRRLLVQPIRGNQR